MAKMHFHLKYRTRTFATKTLKEITIINTVNNTITNTEIIVLFVFFEYSENSMFSDARHNKYWAIYLNIVDAAYNHSSKLIFYYRLRYID